MSKPERLQPMQILQDMMQESLYGGSDLAVSGPPYIRDGVNVQRFWTMPLIAAAPAVLGSIFFFGWHVLLMMIVAGLAGALVELIFAVLRNSRPSGGLLVIVLLFTLLLPPDLHLGLVALGAAIAVLAKNIFGGMGYYLFNPVLVGKAVLLLLFPVMMTAQWAAPIAGGAGGFAGWAPTEILSETPLSLILGGAESPYSIGQLFLGNVPGAIGTTSGLLMLFAGFWMLMTRAVNWRISVVIVATVGVGHAFLQMMMPDLFLGSPLVHVLAGSTLFTAFLVAADPVTSPMTLNGKLIFGVIIGLLILILRALTPDIEGVTFSVLLANAFVPLLDRVTKPRAYGGGA